MADTWQAVARALADRLRYQAHHCPEYDQVPNWFVGSRQEWLEARKAHDRENCAFCADTLAVERYDRKAGATKKPVS